MTLAATVPAVALVDAPIDIEAVLSHVRAPGVGAVSTFLGTVRDHHAGRSVQGIDYQAYGAMAEREMQAIVDEAQAQFEGVRVALHHRIGALTVGDVSVAIAVGHARRAHALDGCRFVIEALKQRVPIWKREHYTDGDWAWVAATAEAGTP